MSGAALAQEPTLTDTAVEAAIAKSVAWVKAQRQPNWNWEDKLGKPTDRFWGGTTALATLALLYAGEDPRSEFMAASLDWLNAQPLTETYTHGTRAHAMALVPGDKFRSRLDSDLHWLLDGMCTGQGVAVGAYGYHAKESEWDNSNSQYGVLGVWMAEDAGLSVPPTYWRTVGEHWRGCQQGDGGWTYKESGQSTGSMTAAGLATLYVVLDRLYGDRSKDSASLITSIDRGLSWFGREYTPENPYGDQQWLYYYLYGVERVGRASGYKYFRQKDWFREGAAFLLKTQKPEGFWGGNGEFMSDVRNTCFGMMFLCHGRAPLLFNKLEHGNDWNEKLRDVAGLTHFAQRSLERLLNWQIVNLVGSLDDLMEAPVLYLTGASAWEFTDVEIQKIREYGLRGGLLLTVASGGKPEFTRSIDRLAERAFPEYIEHPIASDHPLFNGETQFVIDKPPPMYQIDNGLRTIMLVCPEDIADAWGHLKGRRDYVQLGCNIYNYATDKTTVQSRLQSHEISPRQVEIRRKLDLALIKHRGLWNIEPYGWTRLKNYMNNETGTRLIVTNGLTFDSKELKKFKIAYITGLDALELSDDEEKGLQEFVRNGGTLLADAAGGSEPFRQSLEAYLVKATHVDGKRLPSTSFLCTGKGIPDAVDLSTVEYTRSSRSRGVEKAPPLRVFDVGPRLAVIVSPLDITGGLLGTEIYNRRGYDGPGSLRVIRNMLLYADLPIREKSQLAHD